MRMCGVLRIDIAIGYRRPSSTHDASSDLDLEPMRMLHHPHHNQGHSGKAPTNAALRVR